MLYMGSISSCWPCGQSPYCEARNNCVISLIGLSLPFTLYLDIIAFVFFFFPATLWTYIRLYQNLLLMKESKRKLHLSTFQLSWEVLHVCCLICCVSQYCWQLYICRIPFTVIKVLSQLTSLVNYLKGIRKRRLQAYSNKMDFMYTKQFWWH